MSDMPKITEETAVTIVTNETWLPDSNGGGKWVQSSRTTNDTTVKRTFEE